MGDLILIGGGVRSGKSRWARKFAEERGQERVFIATARPSDAEMIARIERHRIERAENYHTVECPVDLTAALDAIDLAEVVVIDCLTAWLSNLLLLKLSNDAILDQVDRLFDSVLRSRADVILVTNEVGLGMVALSELGRRFQDVNGWAHQRLSAAATQIYFAAMGCLLRLRPAPLAVL
jgi:adenosylcobinamide kinase / adenosylcobinamide-phosphate guanylyltransferase